MILNPAILSIFIPVSCILSNVCTRFNAISQKLSIVYRPNNVTFYIFIIKRREGAGRVGQGERIAMKKSWKRSFNLFLCMKMLKLLFTKIIKVVEIRMNVWMLKSDSNFHWKDVQHV